MDLRTVNGMDRQTFVGAFGDVFEHSPWVAERAFAHRPFADAAALHDAMSKAVLAAPRDAQLALLCAHPDLAGKEAREGTMTSQSVSEQASAALDRLTADEMARIAELNQRYRARHGFPFIVAVRHYTKAGIFHELERRAENDTQVEIANALAQVFAIARIRLDSRFAATEAGS
jgi:2-oxo-4-hydroxy-4-carboxy-5-ureidoimidazoline decarboxylase